MKRTKRLPIIVCLLNVGIGAWLLTRWMNNPVKTTQNNANANAQIDHEIVAANKIDTVYFHATLPKGYIVNTQKSTTNEAALLQLTASAGSRQYTKDLAITVGKLPTGGIEEVGDYNLRSKTPTTYTQVDIQDMPDGSVNFIKKSDGLEQTVFIEKDDFYAIVVVQTNIDQDKNIVVDLKQLFKNWQWSL